MNCVTVVILPQDSIRAVKAAETISHIKNRFRVSHTSTVQEAELRLESVIRRLHSKFGETNFTVCSFERDEHTEVVVVTKSRISALPRR